jgi:hypothetical protein
MRRTPCAASLALVGKGSFRPGAVADSGAGPTSATSLSSGAGVASDQRAGRRDPAARRLPEVAWRLR